MSIFKNIQNRAIENITLSALLALFIISAAGYSQELRQYHITCDPAEFQYLITHPDESYSIGCSLEYDSQLYENAELYLHGGEHAYFPKKSFKVNFSNDDRFFGRDIMNLMSEWNDPSFSREYLSFDMYDRAGLVASDSWFAKLYINGDYMGLFLDVEQVDDILLSMTSLNDDASIYEAAGYGSLLSVQENIEDVWNKTTNQPTGFYDLDFLINWLETCPDDIFYNDLADVFDLQELARTIAVNSLLGNSEVYYTNYYMIHDLSVNGKWTLLPRELADTFTYTSNYNEPFYYRAGDEGLSVINKLVSRCWLDEDMQNLIINHITGLCDSIFTESYFQDITDSLESLLYSAVAEDTAKQFSTAEFVSALNNISIDAAGRSASVEESLANDPLPFDITKTTMTSTGVYLAWNRAFNALGTQASYRIEIADDSLFSNIIDEFNSTGKSFIYNTAPPGRIFWRIYAHIAGRPEFRSLSFFKAVNVPPDWMNGTVVTGNMSVSTNWTTAGSPYIIPQNMNIDAGAVLTIDPGVIVALGYESSIIVQGGLDAAGTVSDSIYFVPANPDSGWGALFLDLPTNDVNLSYVSMSGGSNITQGVNGQAMIKGIYGNLNIFDSSITNGRYGAIHTAYTDIILERVNFDYFPYLEVVLAYGSCQARSCRFAHPGDATGLFEINFADTPSEVKDCEFYALGDDALDFDLDQNLVISGNFITGALDKGITISNQCTNVSVYNNIITNCAIGIELKTTCEVSVYNNVLAFNGIGLNIENDGLTGDLITRNNIIWENGTNIFTPSQLFLTVEYSLVEGATIYPGTGNLNSDPFFVDPYSLNFYPLPGSPLIDAAYGTGNPELDIYDQPRTDIPEIPNTGAGDIDYVDIGVIEYYRDITSIEDEYTSLPEYFNYLSNYPNPFNNSTRIDFVFSKGDWANIKIFNILGREVFSRSFDELTPGNHSLLWNGRDKNGASLASGLYFCKMEAESGKQFRKLMLIK